MSTLAPPRPATDTYVAFVEAERAAGREPSPLQRLTHQLAILADEGFDAVIRAEVLTDPVHERLVWMSKDPDGFAHFTAKYVPEGLPDTWLAATGRASWARWYTERRDGR